MEDAAFPVGVPKWMRAPKVWERTARNTCGVYEAGRKEIAQALEAVRDDVCVDREAEARLEAEFFASMNFDFVDCLLLARHRLSGQPVLTFDKKIKRQPDAVETP